MGAPTVSHEVLLAQALKPVEEALRLHPFYRGKLASFARKRGIHEQDILPRMDEWDVHAQVAVAAAMAAQQQGIAKHSKSPDELRVEAATIMERAREATRLMMREGLIPAAPPP
jgi:malate dehydrogenase (oxaloacetate-decarboxylating)